MSSSDTASDTGLRANALWLARLRATLPRRAFMAAIAVLAVLGLRALVAGKPRPPAIAPQRVGDAIPSGASAFAEAFARAYLSYDARDPAAREAALAGFLADGVDPHAGTALPAARKRAVTWTGAITETRVGAGRVVVTVAGHLDGERRLRFLAVPVTRSPRGFAVADYPALVGPPRLDRKARSADGPAIREPALEQVAARAAGNFVRGAVANLAADLLPATAAPSAPAGLDLVDVVRVTESGAGRVAVTLLARDRLGVVFTLRYELSLVRRERWFVRSIGVSTIQGGTEG